MTILQAPTRGMIERPGARSASVRLETGPRLHYTDYGAPDGAPVVFLHGWPDSWFSFSRVLPLLPESRRALAVDQRGFGDSDRPECRSARESFRSEARPRLCEPVCCHRQGLDRRPWRGSCESKPRPLAGPSSSYRRRLPEDQT